MSNRLRTILIIIGFIVFILIVGFLLYYLFFRQIIPTPQPNINQALPVNGFPPVNLNINQPIIPINQPINANAPAITPLPPIGVTPGPVISNVASGGLTSYTLLESTPVYAPTISGNSLLYYNTTDGVIYKTDANGQKQPFSNQSFRNVQDIVWANNDSKAIFEYPDGGKILYDFNTNKSVTLPSQWKDFAFSPDSSKIVFKNMMLDPENRYIATADTNAGDYTEIEALGNEDDNVTINWSPNNSYIAMFRQGLDGSRSEVLPIGLNHENFTSLTFEGRDPRYLYSPSGSILLYSVFNGASNFNPLLWYVVSDPANLGTGRHSLNLATWADKCVFASETIIYCAVPRTLDTGSGYLPSLADSTPDDFYRINLQSGINTLIAQPIFTTTVDKLFISADQATLYWTEKTSGAIKQLKLK